MMAAPNHHSPAPPFIFSAATDASVDAIVADWMIREPEVITLGFERVGGRSGLIDLADRIGDQVRSTLKATPRFADFRADMLSLEKAMKFYVSDESIKRIYLKEPYVKNPTMFWRTYKLLCRDTHDIIGDTIKQTLGTSPYDIWDMEDGLVGLEPDPILEYHFGMRFRHGGVPREILGDNITYDVQRLLRPWLVTAEIADFYQRNRLMITSTLNRASSKSFWGEGNDIEVTNDLSRLSKRLAKQDWGEVLVRIATIRGDSHATTSGTDFENDCLRAVLKSGLHAETTKSSGDKGVDLIVELGDKLIGIQCKKHIKPIGLKAVQEIYSGLKFYNLSVGAVVSISGYTTAAEDLARETGILLLGRGDLEHLSKIVLIN